MPARLQKVKASIGLRTSVGAYIEKIKDKVQDKEKLRHELQQKSEQVSTPYPLPQGPGSHHSFGPYPREGMYCRWEEGMGAVPVLPSSADRAAGKCQRLETQELPLAPLSPPSVPPP